MKRVAIGIIAVMFLAGMIPAFAADEAKGVPNPSQKAYEHASDKARFKRSGDVTDKDAAKAAKKAEKEAEKAKKATEKEAKKKQKELEKEAKKLKKGLGK